MKAGDKVVWFPGKHPRTPRDAEFLDSKGKSARIKLTEADGSTRAILVRIDSIERPRAPLPGHSFNPEPGMSGGM